MDLYYVAVYHWGANNWSRYLLTAKDREAAQAIMLEQVEGTDAKIKSLVFVCNTPNDIYMEL